MFISSRFVFLALCVGCFFGFFKYYLINGPLILDQHLIQKYSSENLDNLYENVTNGSESEGLVRIHSHPNKYLDENEEADKLFEKVRVLCWIMTSPENHERKAKHVKATWAKRCNKVLFMSSAEDYGLDTIVLNVSEGREHLWDKTRKAFKYIYKNHLNDADWFYKADDDTYAIMENLRYMLSPYDSEEPLYFGMRFKNDMGDFMGGGAGYVLSKESVKRLVEKALPNPNKCQVFNTNNTGEDAEIGNCLHSVDVKSIDSRDHLERRRFLHYSLTQHINQNNSGPKTLDPGWIYYPSYDGENCCSDTAVSFHYVTPEKMYEFEYLIYRLRPFGIKFHSPFPPLPPPDRTGISQQIRERHGE